MKPIPPNPQAVRPYFFDAGIRFECRQCHQCCVGDHGTIYVTADEIASLAGHLHLSIAAFTERFLYPYKDSYSIGEHPDGRCLFFDNGCTVYPLRPNQCRTFPFWFSNIRSEERWHAIAKACPGIGRGRLYLRDEILAIVKTTFCF
jgi:Fe-S-cluster containining protein